MLILGHRGAHGSAATENSLAAFRNALDVADGFETDACVSKDGVVFLIHPDTKHRIKRVLDKKCAQKISKIRIDQLTSQDIYALQLLCGAAIPTLRQALDMVGAVPDKILNIELKTFATVAPVLAMLRESFRRKIIEPEAVIVSSFDHATLLSVRAELPNVKVGALLVNRTKTRLRIYPWLAGQKIRYTGLSKKVLMGEIMRNIQPDLFVMPETMLTLATARKIEEFFPQAQLAGWTVSGRRFNQGKLLARLRMIPPQKIAAMIVDDPRAFVQAIQNR